MVSFHFPNENQLKNKLSARKSLRASWLGFVGIIQCVAPMLKLKLQLKSEHAIRKSMQMWYVRIVRVFDVVEAFLIELLVKLCQEQFS